MFYLFIYLLLDEMATFWRSSCRQTLVLMLALFLQYQNFRFCRSLNEEGLALLRFKSRVVSDPFGALATWKDDVGVLNPCSWNRIQCSNGNVVSLDLRDLCLEGTLASDLGQLIHVKSIFLRNNSFSGVIPEEIANLKGLEILDLGHNNFSGPLPSNLGNNLSLAIFLLDNNELLSSISPEVNEVKQLPETQLEKNLLSSAKKILCHRKLCSLNNALSGDVTQRKLLQINIPALFPLPPPEVAPPPQSPSPSLSSLSSPSPSPFSPSPSPEPSFWSPPAVSSPSPASLPSPAGIPIVPSRRSSNHRTILLSSTIGGSLLLFFLVIGILFCRSSKVAVVKPWRTGLSGQLQKAFVTGVPKLRRAELETACEDFSNVIGSTAVGTLYKGTLSSGVEIAVISFSTALSKDWSKNLEAQFREKIATLSRMNCKNFVSLLGYSEEEEPFTRMMVFEYASNGTLFEHLHIKEAEHLDWVMRMRVAMGMAYCLEHMHQLTPPIVHKNLNSSAVYLTEDFAAKISDFGFWNDAAVAEMQSDPESNIYSFGVLLFEIVTGRLPFSVESNSLNWASEYLGGEQPLVELVDPILSSYDRHQLLRIGEIIKSCVNPDVRQRPAMREVSARLREATGIGPDGAVPKLSPLWWAELEILSTEAN